ncbi:DNA breaking-rejoining protein [Prevotella histicola]
MSKYIMQKSSTRPNGWVLTDKENGIVVTFEDGKFNDTQKVTPLEDVHHTPEELARIMRELGGWVVRHHGSRCFSQPYGIEYSEDNTKCFLYRKKSPQWRLEVMDNVDKVHLADSLRKAAEWLTKR